MKRDLTQGLLLQEHFILPNGILYEHGKEESSHLLCIPAYHQAIGHYGFYETWYICEKNWKRRCLGINVLTTIIPLDVNVGYYTQYAYQKKTQEEPGSQNYRINNEYARAIDGNTSFFKLNYFIFHKYNRTMKAASLEYDATFAVDEKNDVDYTFAFYIFKSNQYRKTPIAFPMKLCKILDSDMFDIANVMRNASVRRCPIPKGHHYIHNIMLTSKGWPKSFPAGRYLMELKFFHNNLMFVAIEWMLEIIPL
ncbi:hypothetical protein JTB14_012594 [Gonioctena quinquepunctata]|nr:hypothetical protein JTB14_012594 [Gonioctena quinquepunctata]